ncbi:MAG: DUF4157 domain-containing protein, partial [Lentisphaeraceae bacterium]|nr:DUF4157 domain-containing protein [Lentisphaeraceae bacterium]
ERDVERTPKNFLKGLMGLVPGGNALYEKLEEHNLITEAFNWLNQQLSDLDLSWRRVAREMEEAWDEMSIRYSFSTNLGIVKDHLYSIYRDVKEFGKRIINKTIELVKQAILIPLGEYIRDNTRAWPLVTVLLGEDPITGEKVERNLYNIASGFLMLDPDGEAYLNKLNESGKLQELSDWFDAEVEKLNVNADTITQVFSDAWDLITLDNLLEPLDTFKKIFDLFFGPFERIINFVIAVAMKILTAIKDWLIAQLKEHAHKVPGYPLLTVILGKDPVTQEEVPRTAENFIKGFMSFVPGGLEKFENLKKSGAIDKAFTWLEKAVAKLNLSFEAFLQLFIDLWESFTINDLLDPIGAFEKIINIFAAPVLRIIDFAIEVGLKVLEFIFTGVMGETGARVVNIIKKSRSTFLKVIKNPVGFFGNLLKALVKGFKQFGSNILQHLLSGLAGWLFGALEGAGLTLPEKWDFKGIVSLVMQVLGLTWDRMRKKLVDRLGEKTVARLETAFEFVKILATEGIAGVWQKIMEYMSGLKDKIFEGIRNWVITKIVTIAIEKLATMWNPVGAVIQSIIAIYNTIMFFIERLNQILDLVEAVVNSIANIANGKLEDAANYVEQAMAKTLPVIISFLARLIGLGGISEAIKGVIKKVQDTVDKGIDKVLDWIVKQVKNLIKKGKAAITGMFEWWKTRKGFKAQDGNDHNIYFKGTGKSAKLMVHSEEEHPVENFLNTYSKEKGKDQIPIAKAAYADMIREIEVLDGAYQSGTPAAQQTLIEATKPKVTNAQERLVTALSQMDIDGKAELGKSFIEFGPESGAEKFAIGGPITRIPPDGIVGSPTGGAQILVTEAAERTKRGASRSYVQGHLIGHRYHGPAARNNLVMVPTGVNKKELQQLEDRAGSMMSSGKPFFYGVKAIMHSGTNGDQYFASTLKKIEPTEITTKNADWSETDKRWILKSGAKSWKSLKSGMKVPVVASAAQVDKILATVKSEISAAGDSVPANRTALRKAVRAFKELQISHASIAANFNAEDILTPEGENWSRLSSLIIRTKVQKKSLFLQKPNPAEQQADSMADRIVTGNISTPLASSITPVFGKVHKKCATCEQEQKSAPNSFESQLNSAKGGGKTLDKNTQTEMESGFGADFSGVRVHTGQNAAQMSQSIGARAFTHGNDIYFNSGQYNPESREGKHLLAHELTHTVQQGAAKPKVQAQRGPPSRGSPSIQKKDGTKQSIQRRTGPEVSQTSSGPFVQRGLWDSVTGAAGAVWDATAGAVVDAAGKVVNMTKDMFWSLLDKVAPASLVSLVREISSKGIFGFLKEKITSSLSSIFSGLTGNNEALQTLFDTFGSFSENIISIIEALASGDCGPLF